MSHISDKENRQPYHPSFAAKAAKAAVTRSVTPTPNQIDKVVESVANATKRLSQHSNQSSSSKRKVENRVGPWRLGRTLGKGSTGRVRLAKHTTTGQLAAIKIVPKNIIDFDGSNSASNNNQRKKKRKQKVDENGLPYGIEREIIIMKLISHPNIMALYDVWENKNELYLVLEYVEGGELFDFLISNGRLGEQDAVKYFRMIINGVSYCHKFNICHRDLKPENILLDKNGKIKIADFGMAALETQQKLLETSCGSPHYASPEIVAGKTYHGSPSDVWSCGVILFALLTGHLPFDDPNIRQLLLKVQTGKFHMPSNLSDEAKDLIWSMLRVNPNERISIDKISQHPLMLRYPDNAVDEVENKLDHLDISKPVSNFDPDILNNLQTLWHGISQSQIVLKLQNKEKNSEKMFYYLLKNYKLTHANGMEPPNLQKSISRKTLSSQTSIPRSGSTIITTIQDENGKVLKSEKQELKPTRSPPKVKNRNQLNNPIVASTSFNKSVSFQKLRRDTSASTLSIVNMKRNLSIRPDSSMTNLFGAKNVILETEDTVDGKTTDTNTKSNSNNKQTNKTVNISSIIDNSDISSSRAVTVNPKDLPELPDLQDYKYLMKTIFADTDSNALNKGVSKKTHSSSAASKRKDEAPKSRVDNDMVLLNFEDATFSSEDPKSDTSFTNTSYYTSNLDPKANLFVPQSDTQYSKLELLKKELNGNNSSVQRKFSSMKSIKSSSTRKLNTFLQDEYKNVKIDDYNSKHKNMSSVTYSHKPEKSVDSKFFPHEDTTYSLHSAVEIRMMTPTEEDLRQMGDGKVFEDADESFLDKSLISDSAMKNNITVHRNIVPNVDKGLELRTSLISTSTNDDMSQQLNERKLKWRSSELIKNSPVHEMSKEEIANSVFDDADELPQPRILDNGADNSFDSEISGSLYTTLEEQAPKSTITSSQSRSTRPFSQLKSGVRMSMTPTNEHTAPPSLFNPARNSTPSLPVNEPGRAVHLSPIDAVSREGALSKDQHHAYRKYASQNTTKPIPPRKMEIPTEASTKNNANSTFTPVDRATGTNRPNWLKKFFSAFSKKASGSSSSSSTAKTNTSKSPFSQQPSARKSIKFSFKFNKSKYTPKYTPKNNIFFSEHWLESDIITRETLIEAIKADARTKLLTFTNAQDTSNGCNYTIEVENLRTTIRVEVVDKVGTEYGFGGCYMKFVKLKGTKASFDYWCGVVRDLVADLEKKAETAEKASES